MASKRSMISRRLVRIKTLQALYAFKQSGLAEVNSGKKVLESSLMAPFEVLLFLLEFPFHFNEFLESEISLEKSKYYPDKNKIFTLGLFKDSVILDSFYNTALKYKRIYFRNNWHSQADQFQALFDEIKALDFVKDRMVFEQPTLEQEKVFFEELYNHFIHASEAFYSIMDDMYTAWNDDEEVLFRELTKAIQSCKIAGEITIPTKPMLVEEDMQFGFKLFEIVVENGDELESDIEKVTDNWDPARIAVLDLICIKMALSEFLHFNIIPVKVTINEYLDICREYSTPGSSRFLNGILDKLRILLEKEGKIQKIGRGLRDH